MEEGHQFDLRTCRRIIDAVQWVERQAGGLVVPGPGRSAHPLGTLRRFGVTCANPAGGEYPAKGESTNTWWVKFVKESFDPDEGEGEQEREETELTDLPGCSADHPGHTLAHNTAWDSDCAAGEHYVPEGKLFLMSWHNGLWWFTHENPFMICKGTLTAALASTDGTCTVDNVVAMLGACPVAAPEDELEDVGNAMKYAGADGGACYILYDHDEGEWQLCDLVRVKQSVQTDIQVDDEETQLEEKTRFAVGHFEGDESEWEDFYTGEEC